MKYFRSLAASILIVSTVITGCGGEEQAPPKQEENKTAVEAKIAEGTSIKRACLRRTGKTQRYRKRYEQSVRAGLKG